MSNLVGEKNTEHLVAQCKELADSINSYTTSADKYFGLVGTLGVGASAVLTGEVKSETLLAVIVVSPVVLAVVLHYVCQLLTEKAARSRTKQALEERLAEIQSSGQFRLEEHLSEIVSQKRWSVVFSTILYGFLMVALCIGAFRAALSLDGNALGLTVGSLALALVLTLFAVAVSGREMMGAHDAALSRARCTLRPKSPSQ